MKTTKGFTLIELIVVIILISILSTLGVGLMSGTDQYAARLASDRWLTGLRLAQRLSLQKQNPTNLLSISISQSTDLWSVSIDQASVMISEFDIERERLSIHTSTSDFSSGCSALPLMSFPQLLYFNGYGNLVNSSRAQLTENQRLCFVGAQTMELCISPSGYSYEGSCSN